MHSTTVRRVIATTNFSGRRRCPTFINRLFPEQTLLNILVINDLTDDQTWAVSEHDDRLHAIGLKFDVLSIHVMCESKEGDTPWMTQTQVDYDDIIDVLEDDGCIPGEVTKAKVLEVLLDLCDRNGYDHDEYGVSFTNSDDLSGDVVVIPNPAKVD